MKDEEILKKAIKKAINNGFLHNALKDMVWEYSTDADSIFYFKDNRKGSLSVASEGIKEIIFSHDFAKAFWGEEKWNFGYKVTLHNDKSKEGWKWWKHKTTSWDFKSSEIKMWLPAWQYHLQQMVLEEDLIKYLEKFI